MRNILSAMERLRRTINNPALHVAVMLVVVAYCFGRTLGSYFLADDFSEVAYVARIFAGDSAAFWSNFTGNYMQVPSMAVYRPWLLMTLVFDFGLWKTWAAGYYLTNLIHYFLCGVLIYSLIKSLTGYWGTARSNAAALFSALLFLANPLHCESVSWVVGRVDIVCLMYYLVGLNAVALYARSERKRWIALACAGFWLAILTKEMAIGLPVIGSLLVFLFTDTNALKSQPVQNLRERARRSLPVIVPFVVCTIVYFAIRYWALGTISGGYVAGIGATQIDAMIQKWTDLDTVMRILYPLNFSVFGEARLIKLALTSLYLGLFAMAATRLLLGSVPRKWLILLGLMMLTSLAPIYQLWGVGYNLEGARFIFFLTVPLCMLFPIFLFAPCRDRLSPGQTSGFSRPSGRMGPLERTPVERPLPSVEKLLPPVEKPLPGNIVVKSHTVAEPFVVAAPKLQHPELEAAAVAQSPAADVAFARIMAASVVLLTALVIVFSFITQRNNLPWIHAGKQTRAIAARARLLAATVPNQQMLGVLGIPKFEGGALMILNNSTFTRLLTPPFADNTYAAEKIITFDATLFGDSDRVDTGHFRQALADKRVRAFYRWDMATTEFVPFLPGTLQAVPSRRFETANAGSVRLVDLQIEPARFDYISLNVVVPETEKLNGTACKLCFETVDGTKSNYDLLLSQENLSRNEAGEPGAATILLPLSRYWRWYAFGKIASIAIDLPRLSGVRFCDAQLLPASSLMPAISVVGIASAPDGSYIVDLSSRSRATTGGVAAASQIGEGSKPVVGLNIDGSSLSSAHSVELQILRKNFFFENFTADKLSQAVDRTVTLRGAKITGYQLPASIMNGDGYVQLRARCLDAANKQVGEYSYPLTLRLLKAW